MLGSYVFFSTPCYLSSLRPKYSPQHPILKHPQPKLFPQCGSIVSHPYIMTGKIIVLIIFSFIFYDSRLEDRRFCTE
jgi:hypothetical protein